MRQRRIRYAIDLDTGQVVSQVGDEYAWPILDFEHMCPENNFETRYHLEKLSWDATIRSHLLRTRKIPIEVKNFHRKFWNLPPIGKDIPDSRQLALEFGEQA
jgi:hypothetical protein